MTETLSRATLAQMSGRAPTWREEYLDRQDEEAAWVHLCMCARAEGMTLIEWLRKQGRDVPAWVAKRENK